MVRCRVFLFVASIRHLKYQRRIFPRSLRRQDITSQTSSWHLRSSLILNELLPGTTEWPFIIDPPIVTKPVVTANPLSLTHLAMNLHQAKDMTPYESPRVYHRDSLNALLRYNLGTLPTPFSPLLPGGPTLSRDGSFDLNGLIQEAIDIVEGILGNEEAVHEPRARRPSPRE
jgi:hypothetical protein